MKKITVKKLDSTLIHESIEQEINQAWLDQNIESGAWGKKARWLPEFLEGVESREVATGETLISEEGLEYAASITEYLHPQEFTVDIKDLSQDYDFLLAQCYERRKKKYGTIEEQVDMMYHGTWKDHVKKVKDEEPKPIKADK
jgi:hypothetical protein